MVSLGFVRSSEQCTPRVRHVRVLEAAEPLSGPGEPTVRIWIDHEGRTRWGLDWAVEEAKAPASWAPPMAAAIIKLGWDNWWLDVFSLARTMRRPVGNALEAWGLSFWGEFKIQALILLDVGEERSGIYQAVREWEKRFPWVRFSPDHDFDNQRST